MGEAHWAGLVLLATDGGREARESGLDPLGSAAKESLCPASDTDPRADPGRADRAARSGVVILTGPSSCGKGRSANALCEYVLVDRPGPAPVDRSDPAHDGGPGQVRLRVRRPPRPQIRALERDERLRLHSTATTKRPEGPASSAGSRALFRRTPSRFISEELSGKPQVSQLELEAIPRGLRSGCTERIDLSPRSSACSRSSPMATTSPSSSMSAHGRRRPPPWPRLPAQRRRAGREGPAPSRSAERR